MIKLKIEENARVQVKNFSELPSEIKWVVNYSPSNVTTSWFRYNYVSPLRTKICAKQFKNTLF
jgi:hypothetical protein